MFPSNTQYNNSISPSFRGWVWSSFLCAVLLTACGRPSSQPASQTPSTNTLIPEDNAIVQDAADSCQSGVPSASDVVVRTVRLADGVTFDSSAISFTEISRLILSIPDHYAPDTAAWAFTDDYYSLLREAWAIPSDGLGGIGSEEWLFHFISGQDGEVNSFVVKSVDVANDKAQVSFGRIVTFDGCFVGDSAEFANPTDSLTVKLVHESDGWKIYDYIADFGSTRKHLRDYIRRQRRFFRSNKWQRRLVEARREGLAKDDSIRFSDEVRNYFRSFPSSAAGFLSPEPTERRVREIFDAFPERDICMTDSTAFDTSFYALMKHFVAMPNDALCDKGAKHELYLFREGMEFCTYSSDQWEKMGITHRFMVDDILQVSDSQAFVWARYQHLRDGIVQNTDFKTLYLVTQFGRWVLCDIDYDGLWCYDGLLWQGYRSVRSRRGARWNIVNRIVNNRKSLRSDWWKRMVKEVRKNDPEYVKKYMVEYEAYFKLYPDFYLTEEDKKNVVPMTYHLPIYNW